jgi:hypothetical protein
MTSTLKEVKRDIVTYGNLGFVSGSGNPPLFVRSGSKLIYNVAPGQPVAYVKENGTTRIVDTAGLDASELNELFIGVGFDEEGVGRTTAIRHFGADDISGCFPVEVSTSSPRCGSPAILDFYFDCTKCDETYSVMVSVDDNNSRSFAAWNKSMVEFVGTVVTDCSSCDDCDVEHNCREISCKLADALNSDQQLKVKNKNYPDWKKANLPRPFYATRLHATSKIYCFAPQSDASICTDCTYVAAVKGVKIRDTQYNFVGNTNPADSTQTLTSQLQFLGEQINEFFKTEYGEFAHAGSAYTTGSFSNCCPIQLHINTCDATFSIYDANGATIAPQTSNNPFTTYGTITPTATCVDCDDLSIAATATLTFTGNAVDTQTVTVGAKTYTFQDTLTNVNGNVKIGATTAASITNLVAAVNLGAGSGTTYAAAMTLHPTATAQDGTGDTIDFTAKTAGTGGNSLASTETLANASFGGATFSGGVAATTASDTVFPCGIRVIAERIKPDCTVSIDKPLQNYLRKLSIDPVGEGFRKKPWKVVEVQAMELPAGFGSWIQWQEYQNAPGGEGRRYRSSNYNRGTFYQPDKKSRVHAVTAKCSENYCSYYLKSKSPSNAHTGPDGFVKQFSNIHIPSTDSVTIASWEAFFTALLALNPGCKVITTTSCDTSLGSCS